MVPMAVMVATDVLVTAEMALPIIAPTDAPLMIQVN